jgi:hypothetical protein
MEWNDFEAQLRAIELHSDEEGPHTNVLAPKFTAREDAVALLERVAETFIDSLETDQSRALRAQEQVCRLLVFLGMNAHELEDDRDALATLLRAYAVAEACGKAHIEKVSAAAAEAGRAAAASLPETFAKDDEAAPGEAPSAASADADAVSKAVAAKRRAKFDQYKEYLTVECVRAVVRTATCTEEVMITDDDGESRPFRRPVPPPAPPITLDSILTSNSILCSAEHDFTAVPTCLSALNTLGVYLSSRTAAAQRIGDALHVLKQAERLYKEWDAHARSQQGDTTDLRNLPWKSNAPTAAGSSADAPTADGSNTTDSGSATAAADAKKFLSATIVDYDALPDEGSRERARKRLRMERLQANNLYYLGQAYSIMQDADTATRYLHFTMHQQVLCKVQFNRTDWAENAVHLAGLYNSRQDFGAALHYLHAARFVMPSDRPSEENLGVVAWGFLKWYKARLRAAAGMHERRKAAAGAADASRENPSTTSSLANEDCTPAADPAHRAVWWQDLPLPIPPATNIPAITTFDEARTCFKKGNDEATEACKWYTYDTCCNDFIAIKKDVAELYRFLQAFESDFDRVIAMQQRRVELVEKFPLELNFDAYTQLVRQLYFDVGDMVNDLADMRLKQRRVYLEKLQAAQQGGTAVDALQAQAAAMKKACLSDAKLNALFAKARDYFARFIATYFDPKTKALKDKYEPEEAVPIFRSMMRIASLETRFQNATPKEDYDCIGRAVDQYKAVVDFAERNSLGQRDQTIAQELSLAQQMPPLLAAKQRQVQLKFA